MIIRKTFGKSVINIILLIKSNFKLKYLVQIYYYYFIKTTRRKRRNLVIKESDLKLYLKNDLQYDSILVTIFFYSKILTFFLNILLNWDDNNNNSYAHFVSIFPYNSCI